MKIFKLHVSEKFRPAKQKFNYPTGNDDFGVEQDFEKFLNENPRLLTGNIKEADFHYLPIFWTRWHLNHDYGTTGLKALEAEVGRKVVDVNKTFTICQYDDGPKVDTRNMILFLSSRKTKEGVDIPLLRNQIKKPKLFGKRKKYRAVFVGRVDTHPVRKELVRLAKTRSDVLVLDKVLSLKEYVKIMESAEIALCPRGYGGSSFRFFETMELGIVPYLIGEYDTRPFNKFINWEDISLYNKNGNSLDNKLNEFSSEILATMGERARNTYHSQIRFGKWPKFVFKELDNL